MRNTWLAILLFGGVSVTLAQLPSEQFLLLQQAEFVPPPDSTFVVDQIIIFGNEKTKDYVILREVTIETGEYISAAGMEYDANRIYSLGLFNRVQVGYIATDPPKANVLIVVDERWHVFPFPIFGMRDRDPKKLFYGGGIAHQNFRGRNEKLYGQLIFGYDPEVLLFYRNPMIDDNRNDFLEAFASWRVVRNRSVLAKVNDKDFDERHLFLSLSVGRRFGTAHAAWVTAGYGFVKVTEFIPGRTIDPDGTDTYPHLRIGYAYNTRDVADYAMAGTFVSAAVTKYGFPGGNLDFVRYSFDGRRYIPLFPRVSLAGRVFGDVAAGGRLPSYKRKFFGYSERIRGHYFDVLEGDHQLGTSVELRVMLLGPKYFSIDFIPVSEFRVWKFGIAIAAFGDAGTTWFRHEPVARNRFVHGYGVGLHFLLPYSFVLRTEYALNEVKQGQFILDFIASF